MEVRRLPRLSDNRKLSQPASIYSQETGTGGRAPPHIAGAHATSHPTFILPSIPATQPTSRPCFQKIKQSSEITLLPQAITWAPAFTSTAGRALEALQPQELEPASWATAAGSSLRITPVGENDPQSSEA